MPLETKKLQSDAFNKISIPAMEKSSIGRDINISRHGLNEYDTHFLHGLSSLRYVTSTTTQHGCFLYTAWKGRLKGWQATQV